MGYFLRSDESIEENVRRIAREQLDRALGELQDPEFDLVEKIHQVRKRCKKLRGLIRLIRPKLGKSYPLENAWYRDAARELSYARDAQVLLETHEKLLARLGRESREFDEIRTLLVKQRNGIVDDPRTIDGCLRSVAQRIKSGRDRANHWRIGDDEYAAISGGLNKTYKQARKTMTKSFETPVNENSHEWRKQVKYHWYHVRILRPLCEEYLEQRCRQAKALSDLLGDEHDLCVLKYTIMELPGEVACTSDRKAYVEHIDRRINELHLDAGAIGQQLFGEKVREFDDRMAALWAAWETRRLDVGTEHERMSA